METGGVTLRGTRHRKNEDGLFWLSMESERNAAFVLTVCDGVGSSSHPEKASAEAVRFTEKWCETALLSWMGSLAGIPEHCHDIEESLKTELYRLNRKLGQRKNNDRVTACTYTFACAFSWGDYFVVHVGDSRAYLISETKAMQITEDQTYTEWMKKRGILTENAKYSHALTQCIGAGRTFEPSVYEGQMGMGDVLLVCSDGFCHEITGQEMKDRLCSAASLNVSLQQLADLIRSRGEKDDLSCAAGRWSYADASRRNI